MRENRKKMGKLLRYIVTLAVIVAFSILPDSCKAATTVHWYCGDSETDITVEAGAKFYIGDYVEILSDSSPVTASMGKASYKSNNKKIATVNSKGYLQAKKAGIADITVQCHGKTLVCHLTVEKKKTFQSTESITDLKAAAKTLAKGMPSKISNANKGFTWLKKRDNYYIAYKGCCRELSYDGFLLGLDNKRSEKLAVPQAGRYLTVEAMLRQFMKKNNPVSVNSPKVMKIASATANSKSGKITIKLKKKIDSSQILAAQLAFPNLNDGSMGKSKANITMSVFDVNAHKYYSCQVTLKKGSSQLTVQPAPKGYVSNNKTSVLIKGNTYMLESKLSWAGGYRVTAK